ncbi:hypothetical protein WMF28_31785 [Sorangium sp. So ce590]|uniref:hypothetical protein n=1 Tax=Sorangium sp. So ce590 TaxID=3133317 RepID=UPI003F6314A4
MRRPYGPLLVFVLLASLAEGCSCSEPPPPEPVCTAGETLPCYGGPAGTAGVGICRAGTRACLADGSGFEETCAGEIKPELESCSTPEDDDCNGLANDGCACEPGQVTACYTGPAGTQGVGVCKAGSAACLPSGQSFGDCVGEVTPAPQDDCATVEDENCDGEVNEPASGCVCAPSTKEACYSGPTGTEGVGACKAGERACLPSGTGFGPCAGEVVPAAEDCTTPEDENCDGQVNEASSACSCVPGATEACYGGPPGTAGVGICKEGVRTCLPAGDGWGPCAGEQPPMPENAASLPDESCSSDAGETLWKLALPRSGLKLAVDGGGSAVVLMNRQQAAVAGYEPVNPASYPQILVARFGPDGSFLWGKEAYGNEIPFTTSFSYQLVAGANGHIALTVPVFEMSAAAFGQSPIHTAGRETFRVIYSVDPSGALLYAVDAPRLHAFEDKNAPHAIAAGVDGSVFYANGFYSNAHVIKYDPSGAVAWDRANTGTPSSVALAAVPDGGVVLAITEAWEVDLGCGPVPPLSAGNRDLVLARYDAAGNCQWSTRPGPEYEAYALSVGGGFIGVVTIDGFLRVSLADGSTLVEDAAPTGLTYTDRTSAPIGGDAIFAMFASAGTTDFGLGPQPPYGGSATGNFYVMREVGATRWARSPGPAFSLSRVGARAGGFVYATLTATNQLDLDGVIESIDGTSYFLVRMAY